MSDTLPTLYTVTVVAEATSPEGEVAEVEGARWTSIRSHEDATITALKVALTYNAPIWV
jgi:hypothetical protein